MDTFTDRFSGNISYSYFFTPRDSALRLLTDPVNELKRRTAQSFRRYLFDDDPAAQTDPVFRDIATAQGFLHGDGLPFPCLRILLQDEALSRDGIEITASCILLTYFLDADIMHLSFNLRFEGADTDTLVYMHHMQSNGAPFRDGKGGEIALKELFPSVLRRLGLTRNEDEPLVMAYHLELNEAGGYDDLDALTGAESRRLYGLMSGDEGWAYVPQELAERRLQNAWSSRNFVRLLVFGSNFVTLNLNAGARYRDYLAHQSAFGTAFYGGLNPYFAMRASVAGVNHGILFAIEMALVTKAIADRTMAHHEVYQKRSHGNSFNQRIQMTMQYRRELIATLNRVESIGMTELGELELVVLDSQRITPIVDKVKYLLELLESELDLMYQKRTNAMVTVLTVVGLVISLIGVFYSHVQAFGL